MASPKIDLPSQITVEWVQEFQNKLNASTNEGAAAVQKVLPASLAAKLFQRVEKLLTTESALIELNLQEEAIKVTVVGDTHGQFHDVCNLFTIAGIPGPNNRFVFNGDFIDRGAWGLETLALLCAWKLAAPDHFTMLRGNHETATCTQCYGYKNELKAKYGKSKWQSVYTACKRLFAVVPLAALIQQKTLVLHGGLFRRPIQRRPAPAALLSAIAAGASGKRKRTIPVHSKKQTTNDINLGSIDDLRGRDVSKGGQDPTGYGAGRMAADIMWSDPVMDPGFNENFARGIGMAFGPDVTERFLQENGLSLILRSHEGPDARDDRDDMQPMAEGWTLDHDTPAGKLYTVFSAPDYPQFIHADLERYKNKAAVAVLTKERGDYTEPEMMTYEAVLPRPAAEPYYDLAVPDSDEEWEPAASGASGMTDVVREGKDGEGEGEEVEGGGGRAGEEEEEEDEDRDAKGSAKKKKKGEEDDEDYAPPPQPSSSKSVLLAGVEMQGEEGEEDVLAVAVVMDHDDADDNANIGVDPPAAAAALVVEEVEEEEEERIVLITQEEEEVVEVEEEELVMVVHVAPSSSSLPPKSAEEEQTEKEEEKVASPHEEEEEEEEEMVVETVEEQVVEVEKNTEDDGGDDDGGEDTVDEGKGGASEAAAEVAEEEDVAIELSNTDAADNGDNEADEEQQQQQLPMASSPLSERHQLKSSF